MNTVYALGVAAANAIAANATSRLAFYRCHDCLSIVATENEHVDLKCGACGGGMEFMGRVSRSGSTLEKTYVDSACDFACTNARGPHCDCQCRGKNHGSKLVVVVTVDAGGVPVASPIDPVKAQQRAAEYREAVASAEQRFESRFGDIISRKYNGEWLSPDDFSLYLAAVKSRKAISAARHGKTHKGRLAKLAACVVR